jgi:hypothetical protein
MRRTFLAAVFISLLVLPNSVGACSCGLQASPREAVQNASYVFIGTVTSVEPTGAHFGLGILPPSAPAYRTVFKVAQRWKGPAISELSAYALSNCAFTFERGGTYLVFLEGSSSPQDRPQASKCLPTRALPAATAYSEALSLLGPALTPK